MGSLRAQCLVTLMDRLVRRAGLFLERASAASEVGERRGSGELQEDNSSSSSRSTSSSATTSLPLLGLAGGNGRGGSRDCPARLASN